MKKIMTERETNTSFTTHNSSVGVTDLQRYNYIIVACRHPAIYKQGMEIRINLHIGTTSALGDMVYNIYIILGGVYTF